MDWKSIWESSRSTIISGLIAIVVIIGLFVLFNAIPAGQPAEPVDEAAQEEQENGEEAENGNGEEQNGENGQPGDVELPAQHTITAGENLWDLSEEFYGTGNNWALIAAENELSSPDAVPAGEELTIPEADKELERAYMVQEGDTLWDLAERFYDDGFQWTKIRDANSPRVGTLPNGNPLIMTGQVLYIP